MQMPIFMVLSSLYSHCKSSPGSCDKYSIAPGSHRPLDQANQPEPIDPPIGSYSDYIHQIAIYYYYSARELILIFGQ